MVYNMNIVSPQLPGMSYWKLFPLFQLCDWFKIHHQIDFMILLIFLVSISPCFMFFLI